MCPHPLICYGCLFFWRRDVGRILNGPPIPEERLGLRSLAGVTIPFADSLDPDGQAIGFAFLHPACPMAQDYAPVLNGRADEFADKRICFVGVVGEGDDPNKVEVYRREFGITFPLRLDTDFTLAEALDATVTRGLVLVDRDRRGRAAGRIDDRYKAREAMSPGDPDRELRPATLDLVAGREVGEPRTKAVGCPLDRPERPPAPNAADTLRRATTF